jgi:hypothetical protein
MVFGTPTTAHEALVQVGVELVAVAVAAVIADTGPKAGHAMVALWILLWLVFLITRAGKVSTGTTSTYLA